MRRLRTKGSWGLLLAFVVLAGTAGGAFAYWGGGGTGTATAQLADPRALTFAAGTPTTQLYPGGDADVATVVSNPNPFPVQIGSLALDTAVGRPFATDAGHSGCDVAALTFTTQDNGGAGWRIPPRVGAVAGTLAIDLPGAMRMSADAADGCQGATFAVALEGGP
jgi:hypothetical protein